MCGKAERSTPGDESMWTPGWIINLSPTSPSTCIMKFYPFSFIDAWICQFLSVTFQVQATSTCPCWCCSEQTMPMGGDLETSVWPWLVCRCPLGLGKGVPWDPHGTLLLHRAFAHAAFSPAISQWLFLTLDSSSLWPLGWFLSLSGKCLDLPWTCHVKRLC